MKRKIYKRRCEDCKKYFLITEMIRGFGGICKCMSCSHTKTISKSNLINLPTDLMKKCDMKVGSQVIVAFKPSEGASEEGILIKKKPSPLVSGLGG